MRQGDARSGAVVLAALMVLLGVAGCLGSGPTGLTDTRTGPGQQEPPSDVVVEPEPGVYVAENRAIVRGHVRDDANFSVAGARVSLVGTEFYMNTGRDGRFYFSNVTIGQHTLRVEASQYQVAEVPLTTEAGRVAELIVHVLPREDRGAGYVPHVHDLWGEKTEHVLFDDGVAMCNGLNEALHCKNPTVDYAMGATWYANTNSTNARRRIEIPEIEGEPNIVFPGTKEIQVTLTWTTTDATLSRIGFEYVSADSNDYVHTGRHASGETFVIPVMDEMADTGHQRYTLWGFFLRPGNDATTVTGWTPGAIPGEIDVRILLIRGDSIPVEPAHEDFWAGASSLVLRPATEAAPSPTAATNRVTDHVTIRLAQPLIVPPGTARMTLRLTWEYEDAAHGTALDNPQILTWHTADQHPSATPVSEYKTAEPAETGDHLLVYDIPVAPHEADAFYQRKSNWFWYVSQDGYEEESVQPDNARLRTYYLEVVVFKDPAFV